MDGRSRLNNRWRLCDPTDKDLPTAKSAACSETPLLSITFDPSYEVYPNNIDMNQTTAR